MTHTGISHDTHVVSGADKGPGGSMRADAGGTRSQCELMLESLVDALDEGVLVLDASGLVMRCNAAAGRILGQPCDALEGAVLWSALWHRPADGHGAEPAGLDTLRAAVERRDSLRGLSLLLERGAAPPVAVSACCRPLPAAAAPLMLLTLADVTRLHHLDGALLEAESRYRQLLDEVPVPLWLAGTEGGRQFTNRAWRDLTGTSGRGDWRAHIHPEDLPALDKALRVARDGGSAAPTVHRILTEGGDYRWFAEHISVQCDSRGRPQGCIGIATDISLQRQHDDTIRTLSRALEQSAARIVITDASGRIEYVNPSCCEAYGYSSDELLGQNPRLFKSGRTPQRVYDELWATLAQGDTWRGELTNRTRDGQFVIEAVTISPVRDDTGLTRHYVAVKEDVTAERAASRNQRDMDARLARLERMRTVNALAGGVAHEFNNILVAILGFSDLGARLLAAGGDPGRVVSYLEEIRSAGERARQLVRQLRAFGKAGEQVLIQVDIAEFTADLLGLLEVALPASQQVASEIQDGLPPVLVDRGALQQVLMNLCLNARDAMPDGGTIRLSARLEHVRSPQHCDSCHTQFSGDYVCIAVTDRGAGIPEEVLAKLFEPFFTTKDPAVGSGMGLAVAHGTVHQYGGHLAVDSPHGRGTRVRVYLPVADADPAL